MKILLVLLFTASLLVASTQVKIDTAYINHRLHTSRIGTPYVPYQLRTLDGKVLNNSNGTGKVTLINFWFMDCPGCRAEFNELNNLYTHYSNYTSFRLVAATYDDEKDLSGFLAKHNVWFPVASAPQKELGRIYAMGYPTTLIIDKKGAVAYYRLAVLTRLKRIT